MNQKKPKFDTNPTENASQSILSWLILIILALVWGSSFILIKKGLDTFSPAQTASIRVFVGFLTLIPMALFSIKHVPLVKWKYLLLSGSLGVFFPAFLFAFAQTEVSSLLAGILNSLTPLFALLVGVLFFGQKGSVSKYVGVLIGFLGTITLILINPNTDGSEISLNGYALLVVLAALMYGTNVNMIKTYLGNLPPLHVSTLSLFVIGPLATGAVLSLEIPNTYQSHPLGNQSLLALVILGFVSTGLATVLFYKLLQMTNPLFASSVTYIIPIVAVAWGLLDGETLNFIHIFSMLMIIAGVWMVNRT